jgi:hypothetical protein
MKHTDYSLSTLGTDEAQIADIDYNHHAGHTSHSEHTEYSYYNKHKS